MVNIEQAISARDAIGALIAEKKCNPLLVRFAWHDAGSYSKDATGDWPAQGGAIGSIRFQPELGYGCNTGLDTGVSLLQPIKDANPDLSWADLIQLAGAVSIEEAGGPKIPLRLGRLDATAPEHCTPDGRLPGAAPPFSDGAATPAQHLKNVFYRMGLNDKEIVALSGAHTIGRARPERSGQGKECTKYTKDGPGKPGGSSWTENWLKFDNSYFADIKNPTDPELLVLPTDAAIFEDEGFKPFAELYAVDQAAFFKDYAEAHAKLSELGAKWDGEPVLMP